MAALREYDANGMCTMYRVGVDGITKQQTQRRTKVSLMALITAFLRHVFLPAGYPDSVSEDYMAYQLWDTCQAFVSSISSALATEAVLRGAGVGDETATTLAATLAWLVRDGCGHVGRIAFAYLHGTSLDSHCKMWRLVADILNDLSFVLDLMIPVLSKSLFTPLLCCSAVSRAIVGVAGGATRAAITQHQARAHNMADVAAKDGSQETLVNLSALFVSVTLLPYVSGRSQLVWSLFVALTVCHLYANYRAVRALRLRSINRERMQHILRHYIATRGKDVCTVEEANDAEPIVSLIISMMTPFGGGVHVVYGASLGQLPPEVGNAGFVVVCVLEDNRIYVILHSKTCADWRILLTAALQAEYAALLLQDEEMRMNALPNEQRLMNTEIDSLIDVMHNNGWEPEHLLLNVRENRVEVVM